MNDQHLTYFKIENFKRFESFEMKNLGQFNLIVGDNNIGKTSVLESLVFDKNLINWRRNLQITIDFRRFYGGRKEIDINDLKESEIWNMFFKNNKDSIKIVINSQNTITIILSLLSIDKLDVSEKEIIKQKIINYMPQLWLKEEYGSETTPQLEPAYFENVEYASTKEYVSFVPANLSYADDLVKFFYQHINNNKNLKKELELCLRALIPNLEEIRTHRFSQSHEVLSVTLNNSNSIFPLTRFGDGSVRMTRILLEILVSRNGRLMVDEIGNGIHFTRLKSYWKTVLTLCARFDVQLFATTHSLECQQAFVEALEDIDIQQYQKDARNISLIENKESEVKAVTYDFEQFEYALNIGFNTRGGKL